VEGSFSTADAIVFATFTFDRLISCLMKLFIQILDGEMCLISRRTEEKSRVTHSINTVYRTLPT
jgi:hypothetical protein